MARYKINRGPRYGEIVHLPQSQEINLALILGDIEALPDEAAPPARPIFGIAPTSNGADVCILLTLPSGEKVRYAGPAKGAKDGFKRRVGVAKNKITFLMAPSRLPIFWPSTRR